jgi:hypothetical protein
MTFFVLKVQDGTSKRQFDPSVPDQNLVSTLSKVWYPKLGIGTSTIPTHQPLQHFLGPPKPSSLRTSHTWAIGPYGPSNSHPHFCSLCQTQVP